MNDDVEAVMGAARVCVITHRLGYSAERRADGMVHGTRGRPGTA